MEVNSKKIWQFITDNFLFGADVELSNDASFLENGILDSTGMLELIGYLEKEYDINIGSDELIPENLDSVERITCFLERKLQAGELMREDVDLRARPA